MSTQGRRTVLIALGLSLLACSGLRGTESGGVSSEIGAIEATTLESDPTAIPTIAFDEGASTEIDDGDGVQILQISPVGPDRKALQVAVLFDRPMVAITDLESMTQSVPLECRDGADPAKALPVRARWAGTSTAVLLPEKGSFPLATRYDCSVAAGTKALDGETLEKRVAWTFETPRPHVIQATPREGADQVDPKEPIELVFDQAVEPETVSGSVQLRDSEGMSVRFSARRPDGGPPTRVALDAELAPHREYTVEVLEGVVGLEGPLASDQRFARSFQTYPPLAVASAEPAGRVSPSSWISLHFSTAVEQAEVSKHLTLSPVPPGWDPPDGEWEWRDYRYGVPLAPRTTYTVTLSGELADVHGQKLGRPYQWRFETGDYDPWINTPSGLVLYSANNPPALPFKHLNTTRIDAVAASFDPKALTSPDDWGSLAERRLQDPAHRKALGVEVDPTANQIELDAVDLSSLLGRSGFGWVATRFSAPNVLDYDKKPIARDGLMIVTDLGATLKIGPGATEVWVSSLATGQPVEGTEVELFVGDAPAGRGKTDGSGLVRIEGAPGPDWSSWEEEIWARLTRGDDVSIVRQRWDDGLEPWSFGIYGGFESRQQVLGHAFADRGIYRLGEPVYARATFRLPSARGLGVAEAAVRWTLTDPSGTEQASGEGILDPRGGISVQTALPATGMLGDWSLSFVARGEDWTGSVSVPTPARAYRPPAFRVEVAGPETAYAGQEVRAVADARYLFGAPLKKGEVHWRAWTEDGVFQPEGLEQWSFRPEFRWWDDSEGPVQGTLGDQVLPLADGVSNFAQPIESGYRNVPVKLFLEAEVTDVDRQAIANRSETLVHPGAFYVGVRSRIRLPRLDQPVEAEILAVDPDGTRRPETVEVRVVRRDWSSVREKGMDGQWRWVNTPVDEEVHKESVRTGAEPKVVSFRPVKAGYHVISASSKDELGNAILAEEGLYVIGKGYVGWGRTDDNHIELVPEKKLWRPGETARILVKSPLEKLNALVTVEREGVLWRKVVTLEGTASTVEIPIAESYRPNVYVQVVAIGGAGPQDAPDKGRPPVFAGLVELAVDARDEHLMVEVTPSAEVYRPRDTVEVEVAVQRAGQPVSGAGVTLYAVDESILSLTDYQTPDAYETFYVRRPLSVFTADSRTAALDRAAYLTKGASRGGGGGLEEGGPEIRSKFVTTVTWQPDLRTGPDGKVKAKFELPDNLTAFRIMAVADAGPVSFGAGEEEIRVSRPLMLRPAMPRILRTGDRAYAGVVVHNDVDQDRWVEVTASAAGPLELTGSPVKLKVPAGTSVEVPFGLKALEAGEAELTFAASAGSDRDALAWKLPIEREVLLETVATSGAVDGSVTERIARPDDAFPSVGGLDLKLATTALVGVGTGLDYLQAYPHECLEQRTSRALGDLMALRVRERAGLALSEEALRQDVRDVLGGLSRYRVSGGGLGYWSGAYRPSVLGSAYALELMAQAKKDGFVVDPSLFEDTVRFLRDAMAGRISTAEWAGDPSLSLAGRSYVALSLAKAGHGDAGLENELFGKRKDLSVFGTASLLEAMVLTSGPDGRTAELERTIAARSFVEAAGASVKENESGRWARLWGSDDLSTAMALEALLAGGRQNPLAPRYALHLASSRVGDRWANTRATAGVLSALAAYAEAYEGEVGGTVQSSVTLAGDAILKQALEIPSSAGRHLGMSEVKNGDLVIDGQGGRLYYESRLVYAPRDPKARDEGFTIGRTLEWLDGAGKSGAVEAGATMRVNLTVVTPVVRHNVAVIDRIPAGFEALDASLATASQAPSSEGEELGYQEPETIEQRTDELPEFGGSAAFDHHEIDDAEVRLYAEYLPPGVHTFRYVVRATSPGTYTHPPATVEEMYQPENFGRTRGGKIVVGGAPPSRP